VPDALSWRFSEAQRLSVSEVPHELSQFATDACDLMFHQGYSRDEQILSMSWGVAVY
jgi:hypothetical protein